MEFNTHMSCGLKLNLTSNGWYKYLAKLLKNMAGVSYQIDEQAGMAYISGKVSAKKLLERIFKAGKKDAAVCWVRTGEAYHHGTNCKPSPCYGNGYYDDQHSTSLYSSDDPYNSYNYKGPYTTTPHPPPPPSYCPPIYYPPPPPPPRYYPAYGHYNQMAHYYPQPPPPPPYTSYY